MLEGIVWEYSGNIYLVEKSDICYAQKRDRKYYICTKEDRCYPIWGPIERIQKTLIDVPFVKPNHSYLVHMEQVKEISTKCLLLKNNVKVTISDKNRNQVKSDMMSFYLKKENYKILENNKKKTVSKV